MSKPQQAWAGRHTEEKLEAHLKYVERFLTVLKKYRGIKKLIYIDAFAGEGTCVLNDRHQYVAPESSTATPLLFADLSPPPKLPTIDGSAINCFKTGNLYFDEYWFFETDETKAEKLEKIIEEKWDEILKMREDEDSHADADFRSYVADSKPWKVIRTNCNSKLQVLAKKAGHDTVPFVFLDPYATQVDYKTLKHLARMKSCDVLFLINIQAVVRQLSKKVSNPRDIDPTHRAGLSRSFGFTDQDINDLYIRRESDLLENSEKTLSFERKAVKDLIDKVEQKLRSIFAVVSDEPLYLFKPKGKNNDLIKEGAHPDFALYYLSANKRGGEIGKEITTSIFKNISKARKKTHG